MAHNRKKNRWFNNISINSSTASTLFEIAKMNKIPTIVADIGSDSQDYLSFILR